MLSHMQTTRSRTSKRKHAQGPVVKPSSISAHIPPKDAVKRLSSNQLNILTYNTRTLDGEHLANLLVELEPNLNGHQLNWDIIGLSETKLHGKFTEVVDNKHILFNSGPPETERRARGVGFLLNAKHANSVLEFNSFSDRVCLMKLKSNYNNITIIQIYAPDTSYPDADIETFYNSIQNLINEVPNRDELVIIGDFNAKVGGIDQQNVIGKHSNLKRGSNKRGERLVSFCMQNSLMITNTFFRHRRQWTWNSPGSKTQNTIDYILLRQSAQMNLIDAHVLNHPDISDHRPVRCKLKLKFTNRKRTAVTTRFNLEKLETAETVHTYQQSITNNLKQFNISDSSSTQQLMDAIEKSVINASTTILGKRKSTAHDKWISDATQHAIEQKITTRRVFGSLSIEYKLAKTNIKKMCKIDKEKAIDKDHKTLINLPLNQKYFAAMKTLKLQRTRNIKGWEMKSPTGKTLTNINDILENWAHFYEQLYLSERDSFTPFTIDADDPIPPILRSELDYALNQQKSKKAPGPDGITSEMLKCGGENLHNILLMLANLIIVRQEKSPNQMNLSEIIVLFKKGDMLNCTNYRPICLLSHVYKLVMLIVYNRISPELYHTLPASQAAYQRGRSTTEQIQTLQQIIEKTNEFNGRGVICFIDFTKAFDSVDQTKLWQILRTQTDINPAYINLLANLYEHSVSRIRTDVGTTRVIRILRGVKQGDLASAVLFCIILFIILLDTFEGLDYGIRLGGEIMTDKGYADDVGLMTETAEQMNFVLERLHIAAKNYGLSINIAKTKIMFFGSYSAKNSTLPDIVINGTKLDVVEKFEYLGRILSNKSDDTAAVVARIGCGWAAFKKVKSILTNRHLSMTSKRQTYETYVLPTVLYAAETITWKPQLRHMLTVFQNHIMRWMCHNRLIDRTPITVLTRVTGLRPIMDIVQTCKLRWYGHVKRSALPVKTAIEGMVEGSRRRGRPQRRWRDDIREWTDTNWSELNLMVHDRVKWRALVKQ